MISTTAVVYGVEEMPEPMHLVGIRSLQTLTVGAVELFTEGQALVDDREKRLQPKLQRQAARLDRSPTS